MIFQRFYTLCRYFFLNQSVKVFVHCIQLIIAILFYFFIYANVMAQQVKALVAKPDELSCCIPKVHM